MKSPNARGVTLIELLVAMAIAGIVATLVVEWILHAAKMSNASQARDDRDQSLALVRKSLFEDGTRGRVVEVAHESWSTSRSRPNAPADTFVWSVENGALLRGGVPQLTSDTVESAQMVPHFTGEDPGRDTWIQCDRDLDGKVDPDFLIRLTSLEWTLFVRHRGFPRNEPVEDTLRFVVPLQGPG